MYKCPRCGQMHHDHNPCHIAEMLMNIDERDDDTIEVLDHKKDQVRTRTKREAVHKGWYDE